MEQARIDTLINHKMNFFDPNITNEQRLSMMTGLSKLDKDKLIQLEHSLNISESSDFNNYKDDLFEDDRRFLASFSEDDIKIFKSFQESLTLKPSVEEENKVK